MKAWNDIKWHGMKWNEWMPWMNAWMTRRNMSWNEMTWHARKWNERNEVKRHEQWNEGVKCTEWMSDWMNKLMNEGRNYQTIETMTCINQRIRQEVSHDSMNECVNEWMSKRTNERRNRRRKERRNEPRNERTSKRANEQISERRKEGRKAGREGGRKEGRNCMIESVNEWMDDCMPDWLTGRRTEWATSSSSLSLSQVFFRLLGYLFTKLLVPPHWASSWLSFLCSEAPPPSATFLSCLLSRLLLFWTSAISSVSYLFGHRILLFAQPLQARQSHHV